MVHDHRARGRRVNFHLRRDRRGRHHRRGVRAGALRARRGARVALAINSPGGSVFDGVAIHNILKRHPARVTVAIDGVAASIASAVAMAGDHIRMPENSLMMIHDPSVDAGGQARQLREAAEALDKISTAMAKIYAGRSGQPIDKITAMMRETTWLEAAEAKRLGFIDEIVAPVRMAACFDLSGRYANVPAQFDARARGEALGALRARAEAAEAEIGRVRAQLDWRDKARQRQWQHFAAKHNLAAPTIVAAWARGGPAECEKVSAELQAAAERGEERPDLVGDDRAAAALVAEFVAMSSPARQSAARH